MAKYICKRCCWIYDEEKKGTQFEDLPEDYVCTVCGSPDSFELLVVDRECEEEEVEEDKL